MFAWNECQIISDFAPVNGFVNALPFFIYCERVRTGVHVFPVFVNSDGVRALWFACSCHGKVMFIIGWGNACDQFKFSV